jgi:hypothetical protein
LQSGQATSHELAQRALAHLGGCPACRAEHRTSASRLRARFQDQAAVLLPLPALQERIGWLTGLDAKARAARIRLATHTWSGAGQTRERILALLAGGGASAKIAAGVATVAVLAGAIDATHPFAHHQSHHQHPHPRTSSASPPPPIDLPSAANHSPAARTAPGAIRPAKPRHVLRRTPARQPGRVVRLRPAAGRPGQYEPGGFAYLGVPHGSPATNVKRSMTTQRGGGPFSP